MNILDVIFIITALIVVCVYTYCAVKQASDEKEEHL